MSDQDKLMHKMQFYVPKFHYDKIKAISKLRKMPMSRIVGLLVDDEILKDKPFSYDLSLASEESIEYAYAEQAGKILNFLSTRDKGLGLDVLTMLRYHIGIPCKATFLGAFQECLSKEMIEAYKEKPQNNRPPMPDDYFSYRIAGSGKVRTGKLLSKDAKDYAKYQKLHKKFGGIK